MVSNTIEMDLVELLAAALPPELTQAPIAWHRGTPSLSS